MGYNLGELLRKINEKSGVKSQELEALAQAGDISEKEIGDEEGKQLFDNIEGLLTKEAALNNPDIQEHYKQNYGAQQKKSLLNEVDKALFDKVGAYLDEENMEEIKGHEKTVDKIQSAIDSIAEKQKGDANENTKKALEETKRKLKETQEQYESQIQEKDNQLKQVESEFSKKLTKKEFHNKLSNFEFGDHYKDEKIKNVLINDVWNKLEQTAEPKLTEEGEIKLFRKDNPEMELYGDDNKPATIQSIAEKELNPYLKKSGGEDDKKTQTGGNQPRKPESQNADFSPNSVQGMLAAQRKAAFQNGH